MHAFVSQRLRIAHHHSPAYVSITLRKGEILEAHSLHNAELSEFCSKAYNKKHVLKDLEERILVHMSGGKDGGRGEPPPLQKGVGLNSECNDFDSQCKQRFVFV